MNYDDLLSAALRAQLVSIEARANACTSYPLNQTLQIEARICFKQADALRSQLEQVNARRLPARNAKGGSDV